MTKYYTPDKPQSEYILEDWVAYWSPSEDNQTCQCSGDYQCAPCTVRELEASWRRTLVAERSSFLALQQRYQALRTKHEALKHRVSNAVERDPT